MGLKGEADVALVKQRHALVTPDSPMKGAYQMQPEHIVVIHPKAANRPAPGTSPPTWEAFRQAPEPYPPIMGSLAPALPADPLMGDPLVFVLLFCLLCITSAFAAFVMLSAVSSLAAHIAALVCVTLALGSVAGYVAQEVTLWQSNTL